MFNSNKACIQEDSKKINLFQDVIDVTACCASLFSLSKWSIWYDMASSSSSSSSFKLQMIDNLVYVSTWWYFSVANPAINKG